MRAEIDNGWNGIRQSRKSKKQRQDVMDSQGVRHRLFSLLLFSVATTGLKRSEYENYEIRISRLVRESHPKGEMFAARCSALDFRCFRISHPPPYMIFNLSCPHCRKQATEYEENKWSCLHCDRKFIYAPATAPVTNHTVQNATTVNFVGATAYDLDVSRAKDAIPIYKERGEVTPNEFVNSVVIPEMPKTPGGQTFEEARKETRSSLVVCGMLLPVYCYVTVALEQIGLSFWAGVTGL